MAAKKQKISYEASIMLRTMHQVNKISCYRLVQMFGEKYAERSIYRHAKKPLDDDTVDKRVNNKGRPRKLTLRQERNIIRTLMKLRKEEKGFTSLKISQMAGLSHQVSNRTIRRVLKKNGFRYCQSRKKGLVTSRDKLLRRKFASKCAKYDETYWTKDISFYLDGVGFAHKSNPAGEARSVASMTWRRPCEGLEMSTKGRKEGSGGKMCKFFVAIAYDHGVVMCTHHTWTINGANFANQIIKKEFKKAFNKCGSARGERRFLMDGCPKQNAKIAEKAWKRYGYERVKIPPRSPDLNPIENLFHLVRKKLKREAKDKNITKETYDQFRQRIENTINGWPTEYINNIIKSMPTRLSHVIKQKGGRTKY